MQADFLRYSINERNDGFDTVQDNLAETMQRLMDAFLERGFHLGELTHELSLSPAMDEQSISAVTERILSARDHVHPYKSAVLFADLATLCIEIANARPDGYAALFSDLFGERQTPDPAARGLVAYVANSYTELAFAELCRDIESCRVSYHHHFDDVCQEVYNGTCQYGILPIQSSAEGILAGLYRMIARYKLKICAVSRVTTAHDSHTVFALVRRSLDVQSVQGAPKLELLYTPAISQELTDLLCVASLLGHNLQSTGSYSTPDGETFHLCFSVNPDSLYPFLVYLTLFCDELTPIGLYS